jgi:hypothetical protein
VEIAAQFAMRIEQRRDDTHGFLSVIAAVAQRIKRCRRELCFAEYGIRASGRHAHERPRYDENQKQSEHKAGHRRQHDTAGGFGQAIPNDGIEARCL